MLKPLRQLHSTIGEALALLERLAAAGLLAAADDGEFTASADLRKIPNGAAAEATTGEVRSRADNQHVQIGAVEEPGL